MFSRVSNFFEIAGNSLLYAVPGLGPYSHYQKLKKVDMRAQAIFAENKRSPMTQKALDDALAPLSAKVTRLQKSEKIGFCLKIAIWILLGVFVFSPAFVLAGILIELLILDRFIIEKYGDSIADYIETTAISPEVSSVDATARKKYRAYVEGETWVKTQTA